MPVEIEMRLVRLTGGFDQRGRIFQEGHAERMRAGLHRNADGEVPVDVVVRRLIVLGKTFLPLGRCHGEQLHALAIEQ